MEPWSAKYSSKEMECHHYKQGPYRRSLQMNNLIEGAFLLALTEYNKLTNEVKTSTSQISIMSLSNKAYVPLIVTTRKLQVSRYVSILSASNTNKSGKDSFRALSSHYKSCQKLTLASSPTSNLVWLANKLQVHYGVRFSVVLGFLGLCLEE